MAKQTIILLILLITPAIVLAADQPPTQTNPLSDPILRLVITENLKTREDIKNYLDTTITKAGVELQAAVDDNFKTLDQRLNDFAIKLAIKLGIIWYATTILAFFTGELIFRKIYARTTQSRTLQEHNTPQTRPGSDIENKMVAIYDALMLKGAIPTTHTPNQIRTTTTNQPPAPPPKIGFWEQRRIRKQQQRQARQQQRQQKETLKLIHQHAQLQKQLNAIEAQIPPNTPQPTPPPTNPNPSPKQDTTYVQKTEERIRAQYERQLMDDFND